MTEVTQTGVLATLGINGKLFVAQLVNFAVVLYVAGRWVYKPLIKALDERSEKISQGLKQADLAKTSLEDAQKKQEELMKQARDEAHAMIEEAKGDAKKERELLMKKTHEDVERELVDAHARLLQEKQAMLATVRAEMGGLLVSALEKTIPGALDAGAQKKLLEQAIEEIKKGV